MKCKFFAASVLCIGCIENSFATQENPELASILRCIPAIAIQHAEGPSLHQLVVGRKADEVKAALQRPAVFRLREAADKLNANLYAEGKAATQVQDAGGASSSASGSAAPQPLDAAPSTAAAQASTPDGGPIVAPAFVPMLTDALVFSTVRANLLARALGISNKVIFMFHRTVGTDDPMDLRHLFGDFVNFFTSVANRADCTTKQALEVLDVFVGALFGWASTSKLDQVECLELKKIPEMVRVLIAGAPDRYEPAVELRREGAAGITASETASFRKS